MQRAMHDLWIGEAIQADDEAQAAEDKAVDDEDAERLGLEIAEQPANAEIARDRRG